MFLSPVDDLLKGTGAVGGGGGGARFWAEETAAAAPGIGGGSRLARLLLFAPGVVGDVGDCSLPKYDVLFAFGDRGELGASGLWGARGASAVGLMVNF
jgi:hypothetical protein